MRGAFESEGDIRSVDLLSALVTLWRENASGSLRFSRPGATARFDLAGGELTAASSSQAQFDAAAILTRAGKLDPAALERLQKPEGGDASLAALQAGLITLREWRWGQRIRAVEILSDLLDWLEGEYIFDSRVRLPPGGWTLPIPRLVLELFLRSRDRTIVEHYLGPSDLPLLRAENFEEEFETFGLTSDAGAVVGLIDGRSSAEEIAERAPAEEFAVLKLLAALTTLGLVHPAEAAPEPPAAPAVEQAAAEEPEEKAEPESPLPTEPEEEPEPVFQTPAEPPQPAAGTESKGEEEPSEPEPEPTPEPVAIEPIHVPADLIAEPLEPPLRMEKGGGPFEPASAPRPDDAPAGGGRRGSGGLLGGLLVILVIAVMALLVLRSRPGSRQQPATASLQPTAQENPVFPPVETALPLPTHGGGAGRPSPAPTRQPAIVPSVSATAPLRPTQSPTAPPTRVATSPAPTRSPTPFPTRPQVTRSPSPIPTRVEPTRSPTRMPTRPERTKQLTSAPTRVPTRPMPPTNPPTRVPLPTAPPTAAAPRAELTRAEWLRRAERDRQSLTKRPKVRYAIQLEIACELPTLEKAWNWDKPPGTIWLLTTSFRDRICFRVLWGRYASLAQARAAKTQVPEFFKAPGNRPTIVSVR